MIFVNTNTYNPKRSLKYELHYNPTDFDQVGHVITFFVQVHLRSTTHPKVNLTGVKPMIMDSTFHILEMLDLMTEPSEISFLKYTAVHKM